MISINDVVVLQYIVTVNVTKFLQFLAALSSSRIFNFFRIYKYVLDLWNGVFL